MEHSSTINLSVIKRSVFLGALYSLGIAFGLYLAYLIRFDFDFNTKYLDNYPAHLGWMLPIKLACLMLFGQFQGLLSFFSIPDLRRLTLACITGTSVIIMVWILTSGSGAPPRGVLLADFTITLMGISGVRLGLRMWRESQAGGRGGNQRMTRVAVVGAGFVGASLVNELLAKKKLGLLPVALFDDDPSKKNSQIHGIPVVGSPDLIPQYQKKLGLTRAIIAMPSASAKRLGQIIKALQKADLRFETVPSLDQLATGRVKVSSIRPVGIQDLLGRESIELETESISKLIQGRVVLVSGAGGSIGSELCRQVSKFNPSQMIVLDQSEVQLFPIEQELAELGEGNSVIPLVCDVLDESRVKFIFDRFKPEIVFHAAAHKHVSLMEKQPGEAVKNNSRGTAGFADIAYQSGVDRFILISTDKAINPTSAMGASKRLAEMYLQALSNENGKHTKFMAVRFGNVLGSSGSVVPIFKKQIEKGGPVTVTHPDVTRFFMTIPEAVGLVLQSATQGNGGEIFVLDMGKSIKIVDLARQLIELSGFKPEEDIEIKFTGLRPGEKMYEEISHEAENMEETEHPKIMRFVCDAVSLEQITHQLNELKEIVDTAESNEIKLKMQEIIPEYKPYLAP